ncbi:hypothetical protein N9903_01310, partial [bacterium]|nr:hypothetical protein [bacterium]
GWDQIRIDREVSRINYLIASDYANKILKSAWEIIRQEQPDQAQKVQKEFHDGFYGLKRQKVDMDTFKEIQTYLDKYGVPRERLATEFEALEYFIKNKDPKE